MSKHIKDGFSLLTTVAKKTSFWLSHKDPTKRHKPSVLSMLLNGSIIQDRGADFMKTRDQKALLNKRNQGLLLDGVNQRLDDKASFKHLAVIAKTGIGKTSNFIIPNLFSLGNHENSILVTDPSGELYEGTSAYMQSQGFNILKLDPVNISESIRFNPLENASDDTEISILAKTLIKSSLEDAKEDFWTAGAESIIEFFIKCLKQAPAKYQNLYNLYFLIQSIDESGEKLSPFMKKYASNPRLMAKWDEILHSGSDETKGGFITTALNALRNMSNEKIARLMSENTFDFEQFRKEKTVLYLTFPSQHKDYYAFVLNLFYTQFFYACMEKLPTDETLPVYILYDEFGHSSIPNFDTIITTIRKYKVSITIVLQSISQLEQRYGVKASETIIEGGIASKLFYAGADNKTAQSIERTLGKVIREEANDRMGSVSTSRRENNLLNADAIRRIGMDEALFITENKDPVLLGVTPYYKNIYMSGCMQGKAFISPDNVDDKPLEYIPLK